MRTLPLLAAACLLLAAACERSGDSSSAPPDNDTDTENAPGQAEGDDGVEIVTTEVAGNVYMLEGKGGNIGVSTGVDGLLMIDDQFADLAPKIQAAMDAIGDGPLVYLLNTHYHGDHTGGNEVFGADATIVAHDNVRKRLASEEDKPAAALPVITFDSTMSIHFNGEEIRAVHFANGHTDGDSVIFFTTSNVVHTGDHFFNGRFPYIDLDAGGDPVQLLANVDALIEQIPAGAKIIPGHGPLATIDDLRTYRTMLHESIEHVNKGIAAGKGLPALKKAGMPRKWDSWGKAFVTTERWIEILHTALTRD